MEQPKVESPAGAVSTQQAALLFPDYASLRSGIAQTLYHEQRVVQEYFEEAGHITGSNIPRLLYQASESELRSLPEAYSILFLVQAATQAYLSSTGITFTAVGGLGLGAYAALHAARAYTFADGLYIMSKLALVYQELLEANNFKKISVSPIGLAAVQGALAKLDSQQIALSEKVTHDTFVISGRRSVVEKLEEEHASMPGIQIDELPLEGGLHAQLDAFDETAFKRYLEKVEFQDTHVTCYSPHQVHDLVYAQDVKEFAATNQFLLQDRPQLIERYAQAELLVAPFADDGLLKQLRTRYPETKIVTFNQGEEL